MSPPNEHSDWVTQDAGWPEAIRSRSQSPSGLAGASGTLIPRLPLFSPQASRAPVAPLLLACLFLPSGLAGASDTLAAALFYIDYALTMVQVWVWMLVGVNPGPPL